MSPSAFSDQLEPAGTADSARQFTQAFYDWYVPLGERLPGSAHHSVLVERAGAFTLTLLAALIDDLDAQPAAPGEIVSLTPIRS